MNISVVPFCGLGNRLSVISSAIALGQATSHRITVYWESSPDCRCRWDDLFEPIPNLPIVPLEKFYLIRRGKRYLRLPMLIRLFRFDACFKARKILDSDFLITPSNSRYVNIYIEGNKRFCPLEETEMLSRFYRPTAELEQRIDQVTARFKDFTIGVHIRRTDHKAVIAANPLKGFVRLMRQQEEQHPGCLFYIASDDASVREIMEQAFPGRIVTKPNTVLQRNTTAGMKDAVVELYCLAHTQLIIGSRGSTYSELAAKLYNTPIVYAH